MFSWPNRLSLGETALQWAAQYGHGLVLEQLLSHGALVNAARPEGRSHSQKTHRKTSKNRWTKVLNWQNKLKNGEKL